MPRGHGTAVRSTKKIGSLGAWSTWAGVPSRGQGVSEQLGAGSPGEAWGRRQESTEQPGQQLSEQGKSAEASRDLAHHRRRLSPEPGEQDGGWSQREHEL